jgi:hypothetical protein
LDRGDNAAMKKAPINGRDHGCFSGKLLHKKRA